MSDVFSDPSTGMDPARARALAERLHAAQRDRDGTPLIDHVRRVAAAVPRDARAVAWLHEALEHTAISEQALLAVPVNVGGERLGAACWSFDHAQRISADEVAFLDLVADQVGATIARVRAGRSIAEHAERLVSLTGL